MLDFMEVWARARGMWLRWNNLFHLNSGLGTRARDVGGRSFFRARGGRNAAQRTNPAGRKRGPL